MRERAGLLGSLLTISVIALLIPALFDYTERSVFGVDRKNLGRLDEHLSICVAVVLILVYLANLVYTLITHRDVFASRRRDAESDEPIWASGSRSRYSAGLPLQLQSRWI